jgi:hypothetical protein
MRDEIPVEITGDSPAPSDQDKLDNRVKTSLRERSMEADHSYPGVQR